MMIKDDKIDLSLLAFNGIISTKAMFKIFEMYTNFIGRYEGCFPSHYKEGDTFISDGKAYQLIDGEICHTGCVLFLNKKDN